MSLATDIPTFLTPFIGRAEDVDEVCSLLAQADCRLLSLIGPGGIGKTRLASQVLLNCREAGQSVAFVDLQPVRSADSLASSIADALDLPRCEQENTKEYLLHAIARRKMLLVLDNFEHLLDGVALLSEILAVAPQIQLLVTSRTVLQLQEEWLYPLGGLRFPVTSNLAAQQWANWESAKSYDAVQLFVACARRARSSFEPGTEVEGIVRVCELVDGLPLAIELAAAWAKTMAASDIAVELQSDLTFLATPLRNMPSKHRSMQAVFQRSWQMLAPGERAVFQRLSIFRGGFDRVAASHVAGASLSTLSALVDKSLLRWHPSGRYEIHELLRQFGEAELALSPQTIAQVRRQHSSYYAGFLYDRVDKLTTQQRQALLQIEDELENIRLAWQWSTEDANLADISRAALPFFAYCQGQSRFREGAYLLAAAFDALANTPASAELDRTRADLLTGRG